MKRLFLVLAWTTITPLTLIIAIVVLTQFSPRNVSRSKVASPEYESYTALPDEVGSVSQAVVSADSRASLIHDFLLNYDSPLAPYARDFVETSDRYGLDFRLLPAIAMQESNAGLKIPDSSHNAWGFGVYGDEALGFKNWETAIDTVGRELKAEYIDKGFITPQQIMYKYTPQSIEKGGPWAKSVEYFMTEMQ